MKRPFELLVTNWFQATKLPRAFAGAISAICIGESIDANPMPAPQMIPPINALEPTMPHNELTASGARLRGPMKYDRRLPPRQWREFPSTPFRRREAGVQRAAIVIGSLSERSSEAEPTRNS